MFPCPVPARERAALAGQHDGAHGEHECVRRVRRARRAALLRPGARARARPPPVVDAAAAGRAPAAACPRRRGRADGLQRLRDASAAVPAGGSSTTSGTSGARVRRHVRALRAALVGGRRAALEAARGLAAAAARLARRRAPLRLQSAAVSRRRTRFLLHVQSLPVRRRLRLVRRLRHVRERRGERGPRAARARHAASDARAPAAPRRRPRAVGVGRVVRTRDRCRRRRLADARASRVRVQQWNHVWRRRQQHSGLDRRLDVRLPLCLGLLLVGRLVARLPDERERRVLDDAYASCGPSCQSALLQLSFKLCFVIVVGAALYSRRSRAALPRYWSLNLD